MSYPFLSKQELHVSWWSLKETDHTVQYRIDQREKKTQPLELPVTINKKEKTISGIKIYHSTCSSEFKVCISTLNSIDY